VLLIKFYYCLSNVLIFTSNLDLRLKPGNEKWKKNLKKTNEKEETV